MNDKIERLQREIQDEQRKISNCKHDFSLPKYDPETKSVGYGSVQDGAGSDPHWSYAGYHDKQIDRWSHKCNKCGYVEYTYSQEPVISHYKPKF